MTKPLDSQYNIWFLSVLTMGLLAGPAWSHPQRPQVKPVVKPSAAQPFRAVEDPVDYGLLVRAMRQFLAQDRYLLKSKLTLKAKMPGAALNSIAHIQTIAAESNQFRTKITFTDKAGTKGQTYLFVSNGQQVWTHDLTKNVYAVSTYQQFQKAKDSFLSGMLSRLFATIRNSAGQDNLALFTKAPEATLVRILKTKLAAKPAGFKSGTQQLEGSEYTTFSYFDQTKGYKMKAFIDARTSEIKYM